MTPARRPRRAFDWSAAVIATLAISSAVFVLVRDGQARFLSILTDDLLLFGTMLPKVLAGSLIGAFVTLLLPRETIAKWVGAESGITGILVATVAGAILPGGPFTIYPVAGSFLVAGADVGAACAFVISWTLIGYTRAIVWELPFFGLDFLAHPVLAAAADPVRPARALCVAFLQARRAMNLAIDIALWTMVVALGVTLFRRDQPMFADALRFARREFVALLPRIAIGMIGSGFIAEILPKDLIPSLLGPESGVAGLLFATVAGALTPGGPVVGFAIATAALKSGAGAPHIIAYTIAWALFALPRVITFEIAAMPARVVWLRVLVSLPLPFLAAWAAMLTGRP